MKTKKLTVTVGIPAYNEEGNIELLLNSILSQTRKKYILTEVLVLSDGSTDQTDSKVLKLTKKNPFVKLIVDGKRLGKSKRLMQLYKMNRSDIFIQLDADVVLSHRSGFDNLIKPFQNTKVTLVSGDRIPLGEDNFSARLILNRDKLWRKVRLSIEDKDRIVNCFGCILAMRASFAKSLVLNPQITSESPLIYCEARRHDLKFCFVPEATVYYRLPATFRDYFKYSKRSSDEHSLLTKHFGSQVENYYEIPRNSKIRALFTSLFQDPYYTIASTLVFTLFQHLPYKSADELKRNGLWETVKSTKTGIHLNKIHN